MRIALRGDVHIQQESQERESLIERESSGFEVEERSRRVGATGRPEAVSQERVRRYLVKHSLTLGLVMVLMLFVTSVAGASIMPTVVVQSQTVSLLPGQTTAEGFIDVYFEESVPGEFLIAYDLVLEIEPQGELTFDLLRRASTTSMGFRSPVLDGSQLEPFMLIDDHSALISAVQSSPLATVDMNDGLARIYWQMTPAAPGRFDIRLVTDGRIPSLLSDESGEAVPFAHRDGVLTIVPEPASVLLLAGAAGMMVSGRRRG